jgi:outer membrane protein assembly factor BamA
MRYIRCFALLLVWLVALTAGAQTYTPKAVRIEAPAGIDTVEPLRIAALQPGTLTKEQIEAGMQRLADTGLFSDLSYTVNAKELVIKVTPTAASEVLPVRYGNFVWWQPGELEPLVEAKVPIFKGQLPSAGTLTEQVEAALVELMRQKGIEAAVEALPDDRPGVKPATVLRLTRPAVVVGEIQLLGALPELKQPVEKVANRMRGEDYEIGLTSFAIRASVEDLYQNAGYLDVATTQPTYGPPQKDMDRYKVDLTGTVTPNSIYRVRAVTIHAAAPVGEAELAKEAGIKVGDPASPLAERIAKGEVEKVYSRSGYMEAQATVHRDKDAAAHTVAEDVTIERGELDHLGSVDVSGLSPGQQAAFAKSFHAATGAVMDGELQSTLGRTVNQQHLRLAGRLDRQRHVMDYVVTAK